MSRIFVSFFIVSLVLAHTCAEQKRTQCERNAEPKRCGKLCEPTCEKPDKVFCFPAKPELCKIECRCKDGYVRNKNQCIKVDHCVRTKRSTPSQRCPRNESLYICGKSCEPSCTNPRPEVCPAIACSLATQGCRCNEGYLRDITTTQCVRPKDCVKCGVNEQIGSCGRICEGTCKDQNPGKCAATSCTGYGCMCKQGFYRNEKTDKCVPVGQCPKPKKCEYGEITGACGKLCEGTCKSPSLPEICKAMFCGSDLLDCRCDLDAGFVRDEDTKKCVHKKDCRRH